MSDKSENRLNLEARATALGLKFPANIGDAKLEKRILEAEDAQGETRVTGGGLPEAGISPSDPSDAGTSGAAAGGPNPAPAQSQNTPPVAAGETAVDEGAAASTAAPDPEKEPEETGPHYIIIGPKRGRWRAGMHFTSAPTAIRVEDLHKDELAAIKQDPALTITLNN